MAELCIDLSKVLLANIKSALLANFGPKFLNEEVLRHLMDNMENIRRGVEALRHVDYKRAVDSLDEALSLLQVKVIQFRLS